MLSRIKFELEQIRHFPFDITIGKVNFYCYYHGNFSIVFENLTNDEFYGSDRKLRVTMSILGYTFDFNIEN